MPQSEIIDWGGRNGKWVLMDRRSLVRVWVRARIRFLVGADGQVSRALEKWPLALAPSRASPKNPPALRSVSDPHARARCWLANA